MSGVLDRRYGLSRRAGLVTAIALFPDTSQAAAPALLSNVNLNAALNFPQNNFNPQGLGIDPVRNELLFSQQASNLVYRTDLLGNFIGSYPDAGNNYTTDVTSDGTYLYQTDYTGNNGSQDMTRSLIGSGSWSAYGTEVAGYGGYPLEVRGTTLYRTNPSTGYDWSILNQIRISAVATPDAVTQTLPLAIPAGIADFTVDLASNRIYALEYKAGASVLSFNLTTGALVETWALGLDGLTAGLTYHNGRLYYYDWVSGGPSTLRTYFIAPQLVSTVNLNAALAVPFCNFSPQGLGFDPARSELLYAQQCSNLVGRTDLLGNYLGSYADAGYNFTTDVTSDGTYLYQTDYSGNAGGQDMTRSLIGSGTWSNYATEVAGYGGYPLEVRRTTLYRTNPSTGYGWSNLNQIRISTVAAPDSVTQTLPLAIPNGTADFTVDILNNRIYALEYVANAKVLSFNLTTGALVDSWALNLDGLTAGMTFFNGRLYHYDWVAGGPSVLRIFTIPSPPDADGDYDADATDCNDANNVIYNGAPELCDAIDSNCNGSLVDSFANFEGDSEPDCIDLNDDNDSDPDATDCNDFNASIYKGAPEAIADGIDQNCDNGDTCYADSDDDNYRHATNTVLSVDLDCIDPTEALPAEPLDCGVGTVDTNKAINPGAAELTGDEIDQNCDTQEVCYLDNDDDGSRGTSTVVSTNLSCADTKEGRATDPLDCSAGAVDNNAAVYPSAVELTGDEIDQNCDTKEVCYVDSDDDGYRGTSTVASTNLSCADASEGKVSDPLDCSAGAVDNNNAINPGAAEVCDNGDQDCDGTVDEGLPTTTYYADKDSDTFGSDKNGTIQDCDVVAPAGYESDNTDCNDNNAQINTLAIEVPYDGVDDDCKGGDLVDVDGDGFDANTVTGPDCNDNDAAIHPGVVETIDGVDQDCNGVVDDNTDAFDDDGDGYTEGAGDCDDTAVDVFPNASEICDDVDQDCDLLIDNGTECYDDDGDGYDELTGDCDDANINRGPDIVENTTNGIDDDCDGKVDEGGSNDPDGDGITAAAGDCEPNNGDVYPGAPEVVNGKDENCDGDIDEGTVAYDDDLDGFSEGDGDCDDADIDIAPDASEVANGIDDNCDGTVDEGTNAFDDDEDGVTEDGGDCDDTDGDVSPGATEKNNGVDDNCDGEIDEGFGDEDGDGLTAADGDCDDTNPNVVPGTLEACDGIDNNCDGEIDEACDGDTGDEAKKCGCTTGTGVISLLPLVLLGLLVRRRRGR